MPGVGVRLDVTRVQNYRRCVNKLCGLGILTLEAIKWKKQTQHKLEARSLQNVWFRALCMSQGSQRRGSETIDFNASERPDLYQPRVVMAVRQWHILSERKVQSVISDTILYTHRLLSPAYMDSGAELMHFNMSWCKRRHFLLSRGPKLVTLCILISMLFLSRRQIVQLVTSLRPGGLQIPFFRMLKSESHLYFSFILQISRLSKLIKKLKCLRQ